MTVNEAFEQFLNRKRADGLSVKSIDAYYWQCQQFVDKYGDFSIDLTENAYNLLTDEHIQQYLIWLQENENLAPSTKISYRRSLKIFLKWCVQEHDDVQFRYDRIKLLKMPKKDTPIYSADEIEKIFSACESDPAWLTSRNRLIIALLLDSGIRREEICRLKKADIDFEKHIMVVTGKGNKQRKAHYGDEVAAMIEEYLAECPYEANTLLCSRYNVPLTGDAVSHILYKIQKKTGIRISPHRCRHNFATNYCLDIRASGKEVDPNKLQALMGHEDMVTTKRYMHDALEMTAAETCPSHLDILRNKKTAS